MADPMASRLQDVLARRGSPAAAAEVLLQLCAVEHVGLVAFDGSSATVLATGGPDLLAVGTTAPVDLSTRLLRVREGRPWSSSDLAADPGMDRTIDQMARALGLRSGAAVPLITDGSVVGAVVLSSTTLGRSWESEIARIEVVAGEISLILRLARESGQRLRIVVVHRDQLTGHGIARVIEKALPADVELTAGEWDPRLPGLLDSADPVVVDGDTADTHAVEHGRVVVVVDHRDHRPTDRLVVERGAVMTTLVSALVRAIGGPAGGWGITDTVLTPREHDLLRELASGHSLRMIAERLGISESTARGYSRSLYTKLGVHSRGEAVHQASQAGLT